ncbi:DUF2161 domain-containing phosphodiesterase [Aliiroseovarius sp. YM-037]|uniref:DUF2161 domain-containing phosphodiesterase n=1 Tax=Aliiroseovarius sp. YM-037 TaxID=3341728 RepID=UPI003A806473
MTSKPDRETELYGPIKSLLEGQGYDVKGEVGAADVVALRDGDDPVIVELKAGFSLSVFHQAIARQSITDDVYIAVPRGVGRPFQKSLKNNMTLCRRLGLGLMTVRLKDGFVQVHLDPAPYKPRGSARRKENLLKEFAKRIGDPNMGGATRQGLITAYRQDALRCVAILNANGPMKAKLVAEGSGVSVAQRIMADNHYGWFQRVERGVYGLSPNGNAALKDYAHEIANIKEASGPE